MGRNTDLFEFYKRLMTKLLAPRIRRFQEVGKCNDYLLQKYFTIDINVEMN